MGLNNMELSGPLLEALYKKSLIGSESVPNPEPKKMPSKSIAYLGKNQQRVCLLVNYPEDVFLPDLQLNFLSSILKACKLNLGDVAIVNIPQQEISFKTLQEQLQCKYLILFGIDPGPLALPSMQHYTSIIQDNCTIVLADNAEQLNDITTESKLLKSKLWLCLKQVFNV